MRKAMFLLVLALGIGALTAQLGPLQMVGEGHFAGEAGVYSEPGLLALAYFANPSTDPFAEGWIVYKTSTDGGGIWTSVNVAQATNCLTRPTLYYSQAEIIITYTSGTDRLLARSVDGGVTWQTAADDPNFNTGRTFESSPITERRDGQLKTIDLLLPYPEHAQATFQHPDDPEEMQVPQLFTGIESSPNSTNVYYYGLDNIDGIVRVNSDLWIKQAGGGDNNGWPTFHAPVIIGGEVHPYNGAYDESQVFQGGLIEHAPPLEIAYAGNVNGSLVGPSYYDPNNIMYVEVDGSSYTAWLGQVQDPHIESSDVYSTYPPADPNNFLYTNTYAVCDTLWTFYNSGSCLNSTKFVNAKLWIKGTFGSHQTWAAADTIFILDDILLAGTPAGTSPAGNLTDSVNLISEKSIVLKYGYRSPVDSLRYHGLCAPDQEPHQIYANLFAMGRNLTNPRRDGVFTFEYQHPHPSVPAVWINGTMYDYIDLHRYRYPQTDDYPWACTIPGLPNPKIDLPWYNPLWPERMPYLERGTIQLWGGVYQQRRGFLHRSYYDTEWPSNNIWDIDQDFCGGSSNPNVVQHQDPVFGLPLLNVNYPGASGTGVGYKKQYHHDPRRKLSDAPLAGDSDLHSMWKLGLALGTINAPAGERYFLKPQLRATRAKGFNRLGDQALYSVNDLLLFAVGDSVSDWSASTQGQGLIRSLDLDSDGSAFLLQDSTGPGTRQLKVRVLEAGSGDLDYELVYQADTGLNATTVMSAGRRIFALHEAGSLKLYQIYAGAAVLLASWPLNLSDPGQYDLAKSTLVLAPANAEMLDIYLWLRAAGTEPNLSGNIYHARTILTVPNDDPGLPPAVQPNLTAWPNPAFGSVNIKLDLASGSQTSLEVYNLRGQKVRVLQAEKAASGSGFECVWDGRNDSSQPAAKGIYFLKAALPGQIIPVKRICLF